MRHLTELYAVEAFGNFHAIDKRDIQFSYRLHQNGGRPSDATILRAWVYANSRSSGERNIFKRHAALTTRIQSLKNGFDDLSAPPKWAVNAMVLALSGIDIMHKGNVVKGLGKLFLLGYDGNYTNWIGKPLSWTSADTLIEDLPFTIYSQRGTTNSFAPRFN